MRRHDIYLISAHTLQRRSLQDPHLDYATNPRSCYQYPRTKRQLHRPPLWRWDRLLVGIRLHQVSRASREDLAVGRDKSKFAGATTPLRERRSEDVWSLWCFADYERANRWNTKEPGVRGEGRTVSFECFMLCLAWVMT
jgi:hypothetical protein